MKIYFSAPVSRVPEKIRENYELIKKSLEELGHNVLAEHLKGKTAEVLTRQTEEQSLEVQRMMTKRKKQADLVVIEASTPSFGIGQEIALALNDGKQVIVLHIPGSEPHLLLDGAQDSLFIAEYTQETLKDVLKDYIEDARHQMDVRFNFFVSPTIVRYLDWIAKKKKMPRAVYLRRLIEQDLAKNKEFSNDMIRL